MVNCSQNEKRKSLGQTRKNGGEENSNILAIKLNAGDPSKFICWNLLFRHDGIWEVIRPHKALPSCVKTPQGGPLPLLPLEVIVRRQPHMSQEMATMDLSPPWSWTILDLTGTRLQEKDLLFLSYPVYEIFIFKFFLFLNFLFLNLFLNFKASWMD